MSLERSPPWSLDGEQSALGAALISTSALQTVLLLDRDDFYLEAHRKVLDVLRCLHAEEKPADVVTVPEELRRRGQLDAVGGVAYVNTLADAVPTAAHVEWYCDLVWEQSLLRRLIEAHGAGINDAYDPEGTAAELVATAYERLEHLPTGRAGADLRSDANIGLSEAWQRCEPGTELASTRQPTRLGSLDRVFHGIPRQEVVIVAGCSSTGKTALALEIAMRNAAAGDPVAFFTGESSKEVLWDRVLLNVTRLDPDLVQSRQLSYDAWIGASGRVDAARQWPLHFIEAHALTLPQVVLEARRLHRKFGIKLFILDYIQQFEMGGWRDRRDQELSAMAKLLVRTAVHTHAPWLVLSSLSRNHTQRENKRPTLDDLRDSGGLGYATDQAWALWRESVSRRHDPEAVAEQEWRDRQGIPDPTELLVLKNRNGRVGSVKLGFLVRHAAYVDLDERHDAADYGQASPERHEERIR